MKWQEGRLKQSATRIYVVHAVFVFFLADAYMIFPGIIGILKTTKRVGSMSAKCEELIGQLRRTFVGLAPSWIRNALAGGLKSSAG